MTLKTKQSDRKNADGIVISNLSKSFDGVPVLRDLSLTVERTGVTALMGASGCGKTTLCSLLLGLEKPDAGEIRNPYTAVSCAFQDPRLLPWLSAEENVMLVLKGLPKAEKRRIARSMLSPLGLADALKKRPSELSGGMQQRVSLARAFVAPHELLILDEPFRGLDEKNKCEVLKMIVSLSETRPVLLVTHDRSDADALGARVVTL